MSVLRKIPRFVWRPLTAFTLAAGLAAPALAPLDAAAQESGSLPRSAAAAPADVVLYSEFDLDPEGAQWQQTEELLGRVGMPDALDLWRDEILKEGDRKGNFTEADLDALLGGEMAVIVTPSAVQRFIDKQMMMGTAMHMHGHDHDEDMPKPVAATPVADHDSSATGVVAVLMPGDPVAAWDYTLRQATEFANKRGLQLEFASGPGQNLIWAEPMAPDADMADADDLDEMFEEMFGHHGRGEFAVGQSGDYIIAARHLDDVTSIMDVIDGAAPSLADAEPALNVAARLPAESLSFTYIDAQAIIDSLDPETIEAMQSLMPANMPLEAWGGYGGMTLSADDNGFRLDSISIAAEGVDISAYVVENDPAVSASAERAPEGTFIFNAGTLPPNAFAGAAFSVAQAVNAATSGEWSDEDAMAVLPSPEQIEAEIAQANATLGFNLQTELFDILGDEFIAFTSFPTFAFEGFGVNAVAAVSTTDPATLAETMQKLAALADRSDEDIDISVRREGEDTLYVLGDPESPEIPALEFGVVGDQAVIAVGAGLDQLNAEPATSLADDPQFQTVMGMLPSEYYQVTYVDIGQVIPPLMMLTGEFAPATVTDADLACGDYATQQLAQEALDADPVANSNLDLDFDGIACEDAFAASATPGAGAEGSLLNLRAFAMVAYQDGETTGASAVLHIAEPGS